MTVTFPPTHSWDRGFIVPQNVQVLYTRNEKTVTLIYENIKSPFLLRKPWQNGRIRRKETRFGKLWVYVTWKYSSKEPCFFVPFVYERLIQTVSLVYFAHCSADVENFRHYIFSRHQHMSFSAIHMAFPLSFAYVKTQLHILFWKSTLTS